MIKAKDLINTLLEDPERTRLIIFIDGESIEEETPRFSPMMLDPKKAKVVFSYAKRFGLKIGDITHLDLGMRNVCIDIPENYEFKEIFPLVKILNANLLPASDLWKQEMEVRTAAFIQRFDYFEGTLGQFSQRGTGNLIPAGLALPLQ